MFQVFTFKNPYLGNTCVPFLHWSCSRECAEAIEVPARREQVRKLLNSTKHHFANKKLIFSRFYESAQQSLVQFSIMALLVLKMSIVQIPCGKEKFGNKN